MVTRNGIYYNLACSVYKHRINDTGITFVFSSDLHLTKFEEQYKPHRTDFNTKYTARFGVKIHAKVLPDILLYRKIESRGFLLIDEGGQPICLENLLLNGEKATLKN